MPILEQGRNLLARLGRFSDDLRGTMSVELVLVLPILFWAYAAMLVFYDAYRARMEAQSAALHVADLISRHPGMIEAAYLEGLNDVYDFLTSRNRQTRLRISSVMLDLDTMEPVVIWSHGTRGLPPLNALSDIVNPPDPDDPDAPPPTGFDDFQNQLPVSDLAARIPIVLPGEALILVEAFALWTNPIISGLGANILNDVRLAPIAVTRPRFSPFVRFEGDGDIFPELPPELLPPPGEPVGPVEPEDPEEPEPVDQTVTIVDTDFNDGDTSGWSHSNVTGGGSTSAMLGPFGQETWQNPVTYQVNLGEQSRSAEIEFDLWIIDSWDGFSTQWAHPEGEFLTILVNGTAISLDPFHVEPSGMMTLDRRTVSSRAEGRFTTSMELVEVAQAYGSGWLDQRWRVRIEVENPATQFTLGFAARLDEALDNESFGFGRFRVTAERGSWGAMHFLPDFDSRIGTDPLTRFRTYSGCPERRIPAATMPLLNSDLSNPVRMRRTASGANGIGNCGLPGADRYNTASPTLVVDYVNDTSDINGNRLRIRTQDNNSGQSCDAALLIRDPFGQWSYNDTISSGWLSSDFNARINLGHAATGQYHIWIGMYNQGSCLTDLRFERY